MKNVLKKLVKPATTILGKCKIYGNKLLKSDNFIGVPTFAIKQGLIQSLDKAYDKLVDKGYEVQTLALNKIIPFNFKTLTSKVETVEIRETLTKLSTEYGVVFMDTAYYMFFSSKIKNVELYVYDSNTYTNPICLILNDEIVGIVMPTKCTDDIWNNNRTLEEYKQDLEIEELKENKNNEFLESLKNEYIDYHNKSLKEVPQHFENIVSYELEKVNKQVYQVIGITKDNQRQYYFKMTLLNCDVNLTEQKKIFKMIKEYLLTSTLELQQKDDKINDLSVEENKNTMEGEKMKEITIDFANIISELKNKNLNIVFLKNRNAIFIEDNKNNLYVIEDNFVGSYLDTLILKGKKVVFHLTDSKIGKEIGEWEVSKRRNFKKIEDFIKDSSNFWSKEEKDIAEKILKKGNNKSIRIESEFEDYVLNTEDNNEFTEGENMDNIRYFKSTDPGHKDFIVIEGNKSIKKHLTGSTVWKVDTQKDVIKDYGHKDVNAYINHLKKFNYVEVFEDIKEDSEEVIGVENKELYEVTKKEYLNNIYQTLEGVQKHKWEEQIKNNKVDDFSFLSKCLAKHKVSIINAIWEGKNVSIEVLKDYPEIQEEFKKEIEENKITISSDAEPSNIDCKSLKNNFNSNIPIY
ncbi:hypothetical protein UT300012_32560 [Paraclostridium bifermentans]